MNNAHVIQLDKKKFGSGFAAKIDNAIISSVVMVYGTKDDGAMILPRAYRYSDVYIAVLSGIVLADVYNGKMEKTVIIKDPGKCLVIPRMVWCDVTFGCEGAYVVMFSSYDESYISNLKEYRKAIK